MKIDFYDTFERSFNVLPDKVKVVVKDVIDICEKVKSLREFQTLTDTKKLTGQDFWRTRIGDYRIILFWNKKLQTIMLIRIEKRKDVYRKK